jgi:hypothetical protein
MHKEVADTPTNVVPIDILRITNNIITTTIPSGIKTKIMDKHERQIDTITEHIIKHYPRYQHLQQSFEWVADRNSIEAHFSQQHITHIATDGGYDPITGISTYGWVIASSDMIIVTGWAFKSR